MEITDGNEGFNICHLCKSMGKTYKDNCLRESLMVTTVFALCSEETKTTDAALS